MPIKPMTDADRADFRSVYGPAYMTGLCVALAVAVHRRTGWPLVALRDASGALMHAGFREPGGKLGDARGFLEESEFRPPFFGTVTEATEAQLLAEDPKIGEVEIARAAGHAGFLFPDLPGHDGQQARLAAFAENLERLCRQSGLWIRSDGPWGIPVYDAYGDEGPFDIHFGPDGAARIQRTLEPDDTARNAA